MASSPVGQSWWDLDSAARRSLAEVFDGPLTDVQVQRLRDADLPVTSICGSDSIVRWFIGSDLVAYLGELRARALLDPLDQQLLRWRDADWPDQSRPGYAQVPGSSELVLVFTSKNNVYSMGWLRIRASGTAVSPVTPITQGSFEDCLAALHSAGFDAD